MLLSNSIRKATRSIAQLRYMLSHRNHLRFSMLQAITLEIFGLAQMSLGISHERCI